ncbi:MAG: hypothetical protein H6742_09505 [Alphaproteobacteria bacterium]|nr:hypothetical protein [Alphaproteobacteria bacterium]
MSTEETRNDTPPKATEQRDERELVVEDVETDRAEDVKGGGFLIPGLYDNVGQVTGGGSVAGGGGSSS